MGNAKALLCVSQALYDKKFDYIQTCSMAKDAYEKWLAIYDMSSAHKFDRLQMECFYLEWKQGGGIASLISWSHNVFIGANDKLQHVLVLGAVILFKIISMLLQECITSKTVCDIMKLIDCTANGKTMHFCATNRAIAMWSTALWSNLVGKCHC